MFWKDEINKMVLETLLEDVFGKGLKIKLSYKIAILEEMIWDYEPDIFFTHCHSESGDFERIRILTRKVHKKFPKCTIIITYHPDVNDIYRERHLNGYSYDLMLPEFPLSLEVIYDIKSFYQNKTAHNIMYKK